MSLAIKRERRGVIKVSRHHVDGDYEEAYVPAKVFEEIVRWAAFFGRNEAHKAMVPKKRGEEYHVG